MSASLGKVALGLASLVMGAKYLHAGAKHLSSSGGMGFLDKPSRDSGYVKTGKGPMRMRTYTIHDLDGRIKHLRRLVDEGKRHPAVHEFVRAATSRRCGDDWCIREKDNLAEARAIFDATRRQVRYTSDIAGVDTYQKPAHTLALRSGDCDDYSSLLCSALLSVGIPCRFKVIRTANGNDWNHIYVQAGFPRANPKKWISLDASVPAAFGWEAPRNMIADQRVFPVG
jgi:transglutaminase-like putative cysteine protease